MTATPKTVMAVLQLVRTKLNLKNQFVVMRLLSQASNVMMATQRQVMAVTLLVSGKALLLYVVTIL